MSIKRSNASVYYRIFPMTEIQWDLIKIENSALYVKNIQNLSKEKQSSKYCEFKCNEIFVNSSQEFVYLQVTKGLLER